MRVALIVTGGVDREGVAVVPVLGWLIDALATRVDLEVVALHFEQTACAYTRGETPVFDLGTRRAPRGLRRWVQRQRLEAWRRQRPAFDVWHAWWGIPAGWVATEVARPLALPVVVTASSGEFSALPSAGYGFQRRWLDRRLIDRTMRRAAAVTVPTQYMANLAGACGVQATVVPHGVPSQPTPRPVPPPPWRLVQVAHLNRVKQHEMTIRALAGLTRETPDVHLDLVGEDTRRGDLATLADQLGVRSHVTFHGRLTSTETAALVARAHLHLQSSMHEAGGVAVLEAAGHGVPTVGTAVGYVADWHGHASVAVPGDDAVALCDAVRSLLHHPDQLEVLSHNAHTTASRLTVDAMADAFVRVYHAASLTPRPGSTTP